MSEGLVSLGRHFWQILRDRGDDDAVLVGQVSAPERVSASRLVANATRVAIALRRRDLEPGQRVHAEGFEDKRVDGKCDVTSR